MASSSLYDITLLLLLTLLLSLRLFSFRSKPTFLLILLPILLSLIFTAIPETNKNISITHLHNLKTKINHLESTLEESTAALNAKTLQLETEKKNVQELESVIQTLQDALFQIKASPNSFKCSKEMMASLAEEMRLLWESSRRSNFDIHVLESKAHDVERILREATSEVERMENVVTEQWFQIRQLEHSLHLTKTMTSRVHSRTRRTTKSTMIKFVESIHQYYLQALSELSDSLFLGGITSSSWSRWAFGQLKSYAYAVKEWHHEFIESSHKNHFSEISSNSDSFFLGDAHSSSWVGCAFEQLKSYASTFKELHHELQRHVKQWMKMNDFTATLANDELVFLLASAIVTFPLMAVWNLFSSWF